MPERPESNKRVEGERSRHSEGKESRLDKASDAHEVRNAGKNTVEEAKHNPNEWKSAEGLFAITDGEDTVASQKKQKLEHPKSLSEAHLQSIAGNNPVAKALLDTRKSIDQLPDGLAKEAALLAARHAPIDLLGYKHEPDSASQLLEGGVHKAVSSSDQNGDGFSFGGHFYDKNSIVAQADISSLPGSSGIVTDGSYTEISDGASNFHGVEDQKNIYPKENLYLGKDGHKSGLVFMGDENRPNLSEKLQKFGEALARRAVEQVTNPEHLSKSLKGLQEKFIGIGEGLNE